MKYLRKLLSLLLALTMVLGMVNLSAFAAEEGETETRTTYCGKEEHTHTDACYELTCTKDEVEPVEGHTHTDECYNMVEIPGDYTCGNTEEGHVHTEDCPHAESTFTRGELKEAHEEVEAVEGHEHNANCYSTKLICGKEEHTHSEPCYVKVEVTNGVATIVGDGNHYFYVPTTFNVDQLALINDAETLIIKNFTQIYGFTFANVKDLTIENVDEIVAQAFMSGNLESVYQMLQRILK